MVSYCRPTPISIALSWSCLKHLTPKTSCEPQGSHLPRISFLSTMACVTALHSHQCLGSPWTYACGKVEGGLWEKEVPTEVVLCREPKRAASGPQSAMRRAFPGFPQCYLIMLEASSASGSAQYLLARMRHASADSI